MRFPLMHLKPHSMGRQPGRWKGRPGQRALSLTITAMILELLIQQTLIK